MKKLFFLTVIFLTVSVPLRGQDTLYFKNGRKMEVVVYDVNNGRVKYRLFTHNRGRMLGTTTHHFTKIVYQDGSVLSFIKPKPFKKISYKQLMETKFDSVFVKKNFVRFYLTDLYLNKISLGYEHILNKKYSLEIDAHYRFGLGEGGPAAFFVNYSQYYYSLSSGYEAKIGVSRHYNLKAHRASAGLALSYGEQGFSRQSFNPEDESILHRGYYNLSQKRRAIGVFLKLNFQFEPQKSGFEFFISPGFYSAYTKNTYHSYNNGDPTTMTYDPAKIPKFKPGYLKDGFALIPYLNFGFDYILKQPQKGWYPRLQHRRDSLRIHGKNTLLLNTTELIENAIGITYMRIFYRNAINFYSTASVGLGNSQGPGMSNSFLLEKNLNYFFHDKNFDFLMALNYNFSKRQRSFPFAGVSCRMAQFEGTSYKQPFILNKYYLYLNTGWMVRSDQGFSLLVNLAPGHYFNDYLSFDPHLRVPKSDFNSLYLSIQLGYSF